MILLETFSPTNRLTGAAIKDALDVGEELSQEYGTNVDIVEETAKYP